MKRLLVLLALAFTLVHPGKADIAIVVGADYPDGASLAGPKVDAADMKQLLETKFHFKVYFLPGFEATYQAIIGDLKAVKSQIGKKERFVFYFAGHGLPNPASIVPCDFPDTHKLIEMKQLYDLVYDIKKQPCASATVILDSCFSGGMAKEAAIRSDKFGFVRTRCYPSGDIPATLGSKSGILNRYRDPQQQAAPDYTAPGNKPVCYVLAASPNQKANECEFDDGKSHGIFTVCLESELKKETGSNLDWDQIGQRVQADMDGQFVRIEQATNQNFIQDISITNEYKPSKPFDPPTLNRPNVVPGTALQLIQQDHIDANVVDIQVPGNRRDYVLGEPLRVSIKVGREGYLVVLSDLSVVTLYYPQSGNVEDAKVSPSVVPMYEEGKNLDIFNEDGDQQIRAILFADKDSAARFLSALPKSAPNKSALNDAKLPPGGGMPEYWTATADFQSHALIFGGYEIVDPKGLIGALKSDEFADLRTCATSAHVLNVDAVSHWVNQPDGFGPARIALTTALNFCLFYPSQWMDTGWAAKCPEPLRSKLAAGQALTQEEGGLLLATLFPKCIRAIPKQGPPVPGGA